MASSGEIVLGVLLLVFVSCGFVAFVGCISALLKKFYDKYVLNLPEVYELPPTVFQNLEGRYVKANVSVVIPTALVEVNLLEIHSSAVEDDASASIIAIQVV